MSDRYLRPPTMRCSRCCTRSSPARRKLPTRRGVLVEEQGSTYMADSDGDTDEARALRPLQAAACTHRIAFGPRAGQKVLTLQGTMPRNADFKQTLCADMQGFSLHAVVRCKADERQALEQLCRYVTRPPCRPRPASGRAPRQAQTVHWTVCVRARRWPTSACKPTPPGRRCRSSRRPGATASRTGSCRHWSTCSGWRHGRSKGALWSLAPRPRLHLIRFHGVLAPSSTNSAKLRALVVPLVPLVPQ